MVKKVRRLSSHFFQHITALTMTKATRLKTTIAKKNQIINGVTQEKDKEREKLPPKDTITQIFSDLGDKFINGGFKLKNEDFVTQWENHVDWHVVQSHGPRGNKHTKTNNKWTRDDCLQAQEGI